MQTKNLSNVYMARRYTMASAHENTQKTIANTVKNGASRYNSNGEIIFEHDGVQVKYSLYGTMLEIIVEEYKPIYGSNGGMWMKTATVRYADSSCLYARKTYNQWGVKIK